MESAHDSYIWSLAWHPLGHILASGSNDHTWYGCVDRQGGRREELGPGGWWEGGALL